MKKGLTLLLSGLLTAATASAATVNQTGNNTDGTTGSSFYTATMWDNAAAPSSGNHYVSDYLIRLATSGLTFAGDSLTLNPLNGLHRGSLALMFVGTGNTTVNDLRVNGGIIQNSVANSTATLNGNLTLLSGGALIKTNAEDRQIVIAAKITGIGALTIESAAGTQVVTLSHAANDYTGGTILTGVNTTVKLGSALGLGSTSGSLDLSSSTATLDLNNQNQTVGALTGVTGSKITTGVAGSKTLTVGNGGASSTFAGIIQNGSGTLGFTKTGAGTQTFTAANTYMGSTLVSEGTLLISGTGTINTTSGVTVSTGGTLRYDSSVGLNRNVTLNGGRFANNSASNYTGTLTFNSGTLAGTNLSGKTLSIGTNQILAPGNSTGTLSAGATTWANGGTLQFEINDAAGTAGSTSAGWDLFTPTTLNITAGVAQFTVQILSLDSLQASGLAQNFIDSNNYQWLLVDAGSAITGFNEDQFVLNASGFQNAYTGSFSISQGVGLDTDKLYLNYAAVPEPSTALLLTGALTALMIFRRRRV